MATYKLVWDDFCAWYLEMVKPDFVDGQPLPVDSFTYNSTIEFFEDILKLLHPFMPFITEELWLLIGERDEKDCIINAEWPEVMASDKNLLTAMSAFIESVTAIRAVRNEKNISPKEPLELYIRIADNPVSRKFEPLIKKLCNLSAVYYSDKKIENAASFIAANVEFFIPLPKSFDMDSEKEKLRKELDYNKGFLQSIQKKLSNERFVQNAKPEVVEIEKKKQSDAEAKIRAIEEQLASLS